MNYQNAIDTLYKKFNGISDEALIEEKRFADYNNEVRTKKMQEWKAGKLHILKSEASGAGASIQVAIASARNKINSIKKPLAFSSDIQKQTLAELMKSNAYNFLSSTTEAEKIKSEIQSAINKPDYFHSLVSIIEAKKPTDMKALIQLPKDQQELFSFAKEMESKFEDENNLSSTVSELAQLKESQKEIKYFIENLESSDYLLTLRSVKELSKSELAKNQKTIKAANKAMFSIMNEAENE